MMDKHFIIYRTTNRLNGRFYIGMHVTEDVDDGYLGSGRRLKAEVKKYGRENFDRVVLEHLPSKADLVRREAELVSEELRLDPLCLNLKNGGEGGFDHLNSAEAIEARRWTFAIRSKAGREAQAKLMENFEYRETRLAQQREVIKIAKKASMEKYPDGTFKNKSHSQETRDTMSLSHQGKHDGQKNSQFGTCWMSKDGKAIKVKKTEIKLFEQQGFKPGRK